MIPPLLLALAAQDPTPAPSPEQTAILAEGTPAQRLELAIHLLQESERRLLTPDPALVAEHAAFLARPGTGLAVLLRRGRFDRETIVRLGGATYSFATRSNNYNRDPDVEFQGQQFSTILYAGRVGLVVPIGEVPLADAPTEASPVPGFLDDALEDAWRTLFEELQPGDADADSPYRVFARQYATAPIAQGTTYLLRNYDPRAHDVIDQGRRKCT